MNIRKPNGVLYFLVYILVYPLLKLLFRLKVDRTGYDPPEGPYIVVSNHCSYMDFIVVMLALYPRRFNAVGAKKFFLYRPLNKLLPIMGVIPKNLFDPDTRAIKSIMAVIKRGDRVLLFPEGRCSTDGAYAGVHKSTGKLIKKLGVPVVGCRIEGAYTCMPFWRKGVRLGSERLTIAGLISAEEVGAMTADEINCAVDERLGGPVPSSRAAVFKTNKARKLTEGLQNVLYWCPACGAEFAHETRGNVIRCLACGSSAEMDREARLRPLGGGVSPGSVHEWFREQTRHEMSLLSENMIPVRTSATVRMPAAGEGRGMELCGSGELSLDSGGWHYSGELRGERAELFFPIDTVPALPFDPCDDFQIYAHGEFYMFTPEDPRRCAKYSTIGECAYHRFASAVLMTPGADSGF